MIIIPDDLPEPTFTHWTREVKILLAQQENLLVLDNQMGLFSGPAYVTASGKQPPVFLDTGL